MSASRSKKVTFPGGGGDVLAARLDTPSGRSRAYAMFAHCFTCKLMIREGTMAVVEFYGAGSYARESHDVMSRFLAGKAG